MSESTTRLEFGAGLEFGTLVGAAKGFHAVGTMQVKASKVLAVAAVLCGPDGASETVSKSTGIAESALKRPAALVRKSAKLATALRGLDLHALVTAPGDVDAEGKGVDDTRRLNALSAAAVYWDDNLAEKGKGKARTKDDPTANDLTAAVFDMLTAALESGDDVAVGIIMAAIKDLSTAAADAVKASRQGKAAA